MPSSWSSSAWEDNWCHRVPSYRTSVCRAPQTSPAGLTCLEGGPWQWPWGAAQALLATPSPSRVTTRKGRLWAAHPGIQPEVFSTAHPGPPKRWGSRCQHGEVPGELAPSRGLLHQNRFPSRDRTCPSRAHMLGSTSCLLCPYLQNSTALGNLGEWVTLVRASGPVGYFLDPLSSLWLKVPYPLLFPLPAHQSG